MLISNTFADGTFGALLSVAYTERNLVEEGHSTVRWDGGTSSGGFSATSPFAPARLATTFHPRIPRYGIARARAGAPRRDRLAAVGAGVRTRCSPGRDVRRFRRDPHRGLPRGDLVQPHRRQRQAADGRAATASWTPDGNLVYGLFDNVDVRSESRYDELEHQLHPDQPQRPAQLQRHASASTACGATRSPSSTTRSRPRSRSIAPTPTATAGTTAATTACR